ncbi:MAG: hypothetical protein ACTS6G_02085 [Candidatus Hodgkinia cicadicola]
MRGRSESADFRLTTSLTFRWKELPRSKRRDVSPFIDVRRFVPSSLPAKSTDERSSFEGTPIGRNDWATAEACEQNEERFASRLSLNLFVTSSTGRN